MRVLRLVMRVLVLLLLLLLLRHGRLKLLRHLVELTTDRAVRMQRVRHRRQPRRGLRPAQTRSSAAVHRQELVPAACARRSGTTRGKVHVERLIGREQPRVVVVGRERRAVAARQEVEGFLKVVMHVDGSGCWAL